jgi:hypothetical protein
MLGGAFVILVPLAACSKHGSHGEHEHPAKVEKLEGSEFSRVILTERAIERLDLQTSAVREEQADQLRKVVPYSSLIYDAKGNTWVYTSPEPRTFVRAPVVIEHVDGDNVYLSEGPPAGTAVASVGVAELYGTEFKVGH